jgi:hypothetical protein
MKQLFSTALLFICIASFGQIPLFPQKHIIKTSGWVNDSLAKKVDSMAIRNDSLFHYKNGVEYFRGKSTGVSNKTVFETDNLINRMVNSGNPVSVATSAVNGFHEFDLKYDSLMVRGGVKGWYELFYTVYTTPSSIATVRYVAFHNKADLASNIATTTGAGVITSTASDVEIFGDGYQYPSFVKEYDDSGAIYYAFAYKLGTSATYMKKGRTIADLQAYTEEQIQGLSGVIDFAPVRNPLGGWVSGGFLVDPDAGQGVILSAPTISGSWKIDQYLFNDDNRQPAFKRQADGCIFFKGNRMFYLFQGLNFQHVPSESHPAIIEVENKVGYKPLNQPTEIINDSLHAGMANPVYIITPDGEEVWYVTGTSIKYITLSNNMIPTGRGLSDVVRIERGNKNEVTGNTPLNVFGTVTNSKFTGITATGTNSGAWGFVNLTNFSLFDFRVRFVANSLPASTATIFKAIGSDQSVFQVKINSSGVVSAVITSNSGAVTTLPISDLSVTVGSMNEFIGTGSKTATQFYLIKDNNTSIVNTQAAVNLSNLEMFSLFNDKTDSIAAANQFNGTIYSLQLTKIFPPASDVGIDEVLAAGNSTARNVTVNDVHANTFYSRDYGQYLNMISNTFYMVDNANNTNTRLAVGGIKAGSYYASSVSQGDIVTSGVGQFDGGIKTILTGDSTSKTKVVVWDDADDKFYWMSASSIGSSGGGGTTYTNGYGLTLVSNAFSVDTLLITTRLRLQHVIDSLGAVIAGISGSGASPGGSDGSVQIKSGSSFVGYGNLLWNNTYGILSVNTTGVWNTTDALQTTGHGYFTGHINADGYLNGSDLRIGGNVIVDVNSGELEINAGQYNPVSIYAGAVKMLKLNSNGAMLPGSTYLNYGSTAGSTGYGIRDNAGTMQFKHFGGSWTDFGSGGGGTTTNSVQTLTSQFTDVSNSGTSATDLMTYTLPASQLVNNGDRVVIEAYFTTASNSNNKTLTFSFGGYTHTQDPSTIAVGTAICMRITIIKTGSNTQTITREFITSFSTSTGVATGSVTDTSTEVIKFTGTSNTASNDITQKTMTITYYPITP